MKFDRAVAFALIPTAALYKTIQMHLKIIQNANVT